MFLHLLFITRLLLFKRVYTSRLAFMFTLTTPNQRLVHRLRICSGHLQAIQKQVEHDCECLTVVHQIRAVESALKKIELILIQDYLLIHSKSPEQLVAAIKLVASSSLHLHTSKIHKY